MHPAIFTAPWTAAWGEAINASDAYRQAAAKWEGALVLVVDRGDGVMERGAFADLWHGACREARPAIAADLDSAPFVIRGSPSTWDSVFSGALEPITALMLGRMKLAKGSLASLVLQVRAAREMVRVAGQVTGTFPVDA